MLPINHPYFYYLLKVIVVLFEGLTFIYPTLQHLSYSMVCLVFIR